MKKVFNLIVFLAAISLIIGCSIETEDVPNNVRPSENENAGETNSEEETTKDETQELNKEIVNDDQFKAVLLNVEKVKDSIFGNEIKVKFELENKTDQSLEVQVRSVSADGKMVNEAMLSMSQEISPGKIADGVLSIMELDGHELPELNDNLELTLHVFSWDDMDLQLDYPVEISFN